MVTHAETQPSTDPRTTKQAGAQRRRISWLRAKGTFVPALVSLVVSLGAWEIVGRWIVTDRLFFVPFSASLEKLWELVHSGELWPHLYVSGVEFGVGLALSVAFGIAIGSIMGMVRILDQFLEPWVSGLYSTPLVALTPFYVLVFGIGVSSKIALVFSLAIFPVLINTRSGILAVEESYLEVARSFGAPKRALYREVLLPAALPYLITGIRLAVGRALIAVVIGELFYSEAGVGYLIALASQSFDVATLFAGVMIFAAAGIILTSALKAMERKVAPWRTDVVG
jgi:ABC-type nitrate/sulfonate/bicarbonate transport system permease component